ncbi:NAD(+) diphosphatase [Sphingomonas spermidinifaciens]|uniref:NAD(+) diphosphatase n=1 Tax=Sphingomonas spermidinifaciens TaxID=1141889 RepID=A0A2A4B4N9_9SPHN|nr:NAD(+) diphosphatase [Sphingomonas spermidinifaciens]PCD04163.1 NAD(+) diphosphatase [Sphingomonas spermidinifaciens]
MAAAKRHHQGAVRRPEAVKPGFTGAAIDRADRLRADPVGLAAAAADPAARVLMLDGLDPLVAGGRLMWRPVAAGEAGLVLLGLEAGEPRFAALPAAPTEGARRSPELMNLLAALPAEEMALYAGARSLVDWHARHPFCARCGSSTQLAKGGWARECPSCAAQHFPRTDPVVIMLAEHDGRVLVGRGLGWPPGRYSALAGFVEPGESIEEAVARELFEEAGVRVGDVRYVASQPWPFPSQLMIACVSSAEDDALDVDTSELEDCFWASRADVAAALAGASDARFLAPPPYAIAHTLLNWWLGEPSPRQRGSSPG